VIFRLKTLHFQESFRLDNSELEEQLTIKGSAFIKNKNSNRDPGIDIIHSEIGRSLTIESSRIQQLNILRSRIGERFSINNNSIFERLRLYYLNLSGDFRFSNSVVDQINFTRSELGGGIYFDSKKNSTIQQFKVIASKLGESISLNASGKGVFTFDEFQILETDIHRDVNLDKTVFRQKGVKLSDSTIRRTLSFGHDQNSCPTWAPDSTLNLRLTSTRTLQLPMICNSNPSSVELYGFAFDDLVENAEGTGVSASERPLSWYLQWLALDASLNPKVYFDWANFVKEHGNDVTSSGINIAMHERQRVAYWGQKHYGQAITAEASRLIVGYGYQPTRALIWISVLIGIGAVVLKFTKQGIQNNLPFGLSYSLDMLLPIVKLRGSHYDIKLHGFAKYYFYAHQLFGYILVGFLLAGLANVTK